MKGKTQKIATSAVMTALSTALALVCALIPFLNLPFGGGFTVASMLPIVLVSYMYGIRWGVCTAFAYSLIQLMLGAFTGGGYVISLFTVGSDDFMGIGAGIAIVIVDYIVAYTLIGLGGMFRNRLGKTSALAAGTVAALSLRYLAHIVSGTVFFGVWAEWFFSQEGFPVGTFVLEHFSGLGLSILYAAVYNGLFMLPEIIITAIAAVIISRLPHIKRYK